MALTTEEKAKFLGIKAVKVWGLVTLFISPFLFHPFYFTLFISLSRASAFWRMASREKHADYSYF
jgi:hypothetical protein